MTETGKTAESTGKTPEKTAVQIAAENGKFAGIDGVCSICGKRANHAVGSTCTAHLGKVRKFYTVLTSAPDPKVYMTVKSLCDEAEKLGKTRSWAVGLTGGDAGTKKAMDGFEVYIVELGKDRIRKYVKKTALKLMTDLVKKTSPVKK